MSVEQELLKVVLTLPVLSDFDEPLKSEVVAWNGAMKANGEQLM